MQRKVDIRMQLAVGYSSRASTVALDEVKLALAADPQYADGYGMRGLIYQQMGELALAEDNFVRARKLAPNNPDLANNYGSSCARWGASRKPCRCSMQHWPTAPTARLPAQPTTLARVH
jgi:type IV pilus assembly protein PilF